MKSWSSVALLLLVGIAVAQPPAQAGDVQAVAARPLLVGDLPVGTVTVRVGRGSLSNAAVGVEVVATVTSPGGKVSQRTEKTKSDGRATFSDLPVGAEFHAEAQVDGERLQTAVFAIPAQGGARLMLLSQAGQGEDESEAAGAPANPHAGAHGHGGRFAQAAVRGLAGAVTAKVGLAAGTLELRFVEPDGAPVVGQEVSLGHRTGVQEAMAFVTSRSGKDGLVRFAGLETGEQHEYVAMIDREGLLLGSAAIRLSGDHGFAGELRVPGQTSDPSVLQVSSSSKLLIDLREDALAVMENLVLENTSDRIFNPGPGGLRIPLPAGSSSGSPIEGGARLEASESSTMLLRDAVPPTSLAIPVQARFGFFIPTAGESRITLRQPMPFGIESPVVMVPEDHHLSLIAPGLQAVAPQADDRGGRIQIFQLASVPRNGVLSISVSGLPTRGSLGKTMATVLVAMLAFAALLGLRRPRAAGQAKNRDHQRDRLFAELVEVERARRSTGADDTQLAQRRAELVAAIEAMEAGPDPAKRW